MTLLENLNVLEKKLAQIIELLRTEKALTVQLTKENDKLTAQLLEKVEDTLLNEAKGREDLDREREMTKAAIDELIGNIDRLVQTMPVEAAREESKARSG